MAARQKRRERPDMEMQTAVPVTPTASDDEEELTIPSRPPTSNYFANGIPRGMLPNNSPAKTRVGLTPPRNETEEETLPSGNKDYTMLFTLAAGIGLGVLLCYKGFEYITPAVKTATTMVENTQ